MTIRQRGAPKQGPSKDSGKEKESTSTSTNDEKPKSKSGPFSGRFNPKFQPPKKSATDKESGGFLSHSAWSKIVLGAALVIVIYFTNMTAKSNQTTVMARRDEILEKKRTQSFLCAPSYKREIEDLGNPACIPAKCGRAVIDQVFSVEESHALLNIAKKGLIKGGSNGGASILDLHSGALSKGDAFVNIYKAHPGLFTPKEFEAYNNAKNKVRDYISEHFGVSQLYLTHPTFFSRLDSKASSTVHDEYWHLHIDRETYPNFHYTSLLYLTDHGVDFNGGEFVFVDSHDKLNRTVQPREGRLSVFTSGIENKHYVEKVTSGVRYALTMGFTCDKSKAIHDPGSPEHLSNV